MKYTTIRIEGAILSADILDKIEQGEIGGQLAKDFGFFAKIKVKDEIDGFNKVMYLVHPVLHELWIGARKRREINHLINFGAKFIQLGRLVVPSSATQVLIGRVCQKLRSSGGLDPANPRIYNDVSIF